jgi:hypothetical protein
MGKAMSALHHRRLVSDQLDLLVTEAPDDRGVLTDDHRRSLSARFRAIAAHEHRRLDAWSVEKAGATAGPFRWSPATTRRTLGNAALRRLENRPTTSIVDAVTDEVTDQLLRAASGYARGGSMAQWLAQCPQPVVGLVVAEAVNWATQIMEITEGLDHPWKIALSDAYYDVAAARTTLRARRDLILSNDTGRIVMRVRSGSPGKSAGPGLRADLTMETLADPDGVAPLRFIGLWPEAGVCLAVDGTMTDLRAGARDLVRTAVVRQRHRTPHVA